MTALVERVRATWRRTDAHLLVVCSVPLLQVLANGEWIFPFVGSIDPWVYFGYFNNLGDHLRTFTGTYYGSRLAWLVPGALVYRVLNPVLANYVLHLGLCELALISLYFTLKWTTRRDVAFFTTVATAAYPFFLWSMGWDYVDGAGITYYLIAMFLSTAAARSRHQSILVALSGAAYAAAIHTNMIWLLFTPLMITYGLVELEARTLRRALAVVSWFATGGLILTAMLGTFNAFLTGKWLFFASSFAVAGELSTRNAWKIAGYTWVSRAPWLVLPAAMSLVAVWFVLNVATRRFVATRRTVFFAVQYLFALLAFVALEARGLPMFESQFYMSYLIPMMALAFAAVIHSTGRGDVFASPVIGFFVSLMAACTYSDGVLSSIPSGKPESTSMWALASIAVATIGFSIRTPTAVIASIAALAIANAAMADRRVFLENPPAQNEVVFRAVVETLPLIRSCGASGDTRFWYDVTERNGSVYRAAASTQLWSYRLVSEAFPSLVNPISGSKSSPEVGDRILMMSGDAERWRRATEVLWPLGVEVQQVWSRVVSEGDLRFAASCLELTGFHPDGATPSFVPAESFTGSQARGFAAAVGLGADGQTLEVTTNHSTYDWQVRSDAIPVDPKVSYSLEFTHTIDDGGMGVSVTDEKWAVLASSNWCSPRPNRARRIQFRTENESAIRIVLSNCSPSARVSRFSMTDVRIWRASSD